MSHDFEHHRSNWPLRRVGDWVQNGFTITVAAALIMGCIKGIRVASQWMDRVSRIERFDEEFEIKWARKIDDNTTATRVLQQKVDDLRDGQEEIKQIVLRRFPWRP